MAMRALEPVFAAIERGNFAIAARHPGRLSQLVGLALRPSACASSEWRRRGPTGGGPP